MDLNWDDLRVLLAVGNEGSVAGAARSLGVSRATIHRRLGQLSTTLDEPLWERTPDGLLLTPAGEELVALAGRIDTDVRDVSRKVAGSTQSMSGPVHLTAFEVGFDLFAPAITEFAQQHPQIQLSVTVSNGVVSLQRREADVALRAADAPDDALFGRRIGRLEFGLYGTPEVLDDDDPPWVLPAVGAPRTLKFARETSPGPMRVSIRANTMGAVHRSAALGLGLALLPYPMGEADQRLRKRGDGPVPDMGIDLWVLTHRDLQRSTPARGLMSWLADAAQRCLTAG